MDDSKLDKVIVRTPGSEPVVVIVELALTPEQHAQGLMYRKSLEINHGMLFIFPEEAQRSFWMKNTLIELDMIFIRADKTLLGCVERAEPQTTSPRLVPGDSMYVLEVQGGFCKANGVNQQTNFEFNLPSLSR